MKEEYDKATKLWTTVFAVIVMLLIQWPAFIAPRLDHPPRDGHFVWNVIAVSIALLVPLAWLIDDLRRYRIGAPWLIALIPIVAWVTVSFFILEA